MESPFRENHKAGCRLIETMGRGADGIRYLDLHLSRLETSAARLGFPFDRSAVMAALAGLPDQDERIRLTLDASGQVEVMTGHLPPNPPFWTVRIHDTRLDPDDPWLTVKTTNRQLYDDARAALPAGVDEWLFLNTRGEVCEGTISNIFVVTAYGRRLTPPLSSGLLPGTLRRHLLQSGWSEGVLTLRDLQSAREIFMGNALRGPIPVDPASFA